MKCDNCEKELAESEAFQWQGLTPIYCSPQCAAWGCPNAILHRINIDEQQSKERGKYGN